MKEHIRQQKLQDGSAVTRAQASTLVDNATQYSGVLSGSGYTGVKVWRNGVRIGKSGLHYNGRATGYEENASPKPGRYADWKVGDTVAIEWSGNVYHFHRDFAPVEALRQRGVNVRGTLEVV